MPARRCTTVAGFKAGRISLHELVLAEVGDVRGKSPKFLRALFAPIFTIRGPCLTISLTWFSLPMAPSPGCPICGAGFNSEDDASELAIQYPYFRPGHDPFPERPRLCGPVLRRSSLTRLSLVGSSYIADQHPFASIFAPSRAHDMVSCPKWHCRWSSGSHWPRLLGRGNQSSRDHSAMSLQERARQRRMDSYDR